MKRLFSLMLIALSFFIYQNIFPANDDDEVCLDCHGDKSMYTEKHGKKISLYINAKIYNTSVHKDNGCVSCHMDVDPEDLPHNEDLEKVDCSGCHDEPAEKFNRSLHGKALRQGKKLAPTCSSCHGKHDILSAKNENSKTYVMNIPYLCGSCHKEGTEVSKLRAIKQHNILENYSQSIHGDGIYKRGLTVSAVCNSCHRSHDILPHEDPRSSINRNNIPKTCMQCHSQIEKVHQKVINGELWEKKPHSIPPCVDCHQPHKVRRILYEGSYPNSVCMKCHSNKNISKIVNGVKKSLFVDENDLKHSVHKDNSCIKCHANINTANNPVCISSGKVDCSMCHSEEVDKYKTSMHGKLYALSDKDAPYCTDCHGSHKMMANKDVNSPTFRINIPKLCGDCHQEGNRAAKRYKGEDHNVIKNYQMSIHGKGLSESGLVVTATCIDCHTSHEGLPHTDPKSSIHKDNIAQTCAKCHMGIYEQFRHSIHSPEVTKTDKKLPVCNDCHSSHTINRVDEGDFRQQILNQCGKCHEEVAETYFDTFHGKVSKLGSIKTAKCYDCHGAHNILPIDNPKSKLSRQNVIETCKACHPNSNRKFVGYLTHATHHDKNKYPMLYYTFWFMTILLVGTFSFFGLHTLLWIPRGLFEKRKSQKSIKAGKKLRKAQIKEESDSKEQEPDSNDEENNDTMTNNNDGDENGK